MFFFLPFLTNCAQFYSVQSTDNYSTANNYVLLHARSVVDRHSAQTKLRLADIPSAGQQFHSVHRQRRQIPVEFERNRQVRAQIAVGHGQQNVRAAAIVQGQLRGQ